MSRDEELTLELKGISENTDNLEPMEGEDGCYLDADDSDPDELEEGKKKKAKVLQLQKIREYLSTI